MNINLATKAALLSALLFSGWGQLFLKKYKRGLAIMLATILGIVLILLNVVQVALTVFKAAPLKKEDVNFSAFIELSINVVKSLNLFQLLIILSILIVLWIFSIVDAYLLGKKEMAKVSTVSRR